MADINRTFIVVVVFLGWFAILVNTMPSIFVYGGSRQEYEIPEEWGAEQLFYGNITTEDNGTMIYNSAGPFAAELELYLEGYDVNIDWFWDIYTTKNATEVWRWWYVFWFFSDQEHIEPFPLERSYVMDHITEDTNVSRFTMSDMAYQYYTAITYNETAYSSFDDAWDNGELWVWMGMGYSQHPSTVSAWNILAQLLFFQMPDVHPAVNALIAIPLWAAIGILVYRLILMAIPFLGGGG